MVAPGFVLLFRPIEKPELAGHRARVEEITANIDHHIDRAGLDQLLANRRFVAAGARRLRGHHDARPAGLVQIAVESRTARGSSRSRPSSPC